MSDGVVNVDGDTLHFPDEIYRNGETVRTFRSAWTPNGDGGYLAITEEKTAEGWKESFRIELGRSRSVDE